MYIEFDSRSLLKSLELTIDHLKIVKFKNIQFTRGPENDVTTNIDNI
jgi:hypothetical protein